MLWQFVMFLFVTDVDECEYHDCGQGECTNTEGSFLCECHEGYAVNEKQVCVGRWLESFLETYELKRSYSIVSVA